MNEPSKKPQNTAPTKRRAYSAPLVREEEVFERLALQGNSSGCTGELGVCDRPGTGGQVSEF